MQHSRSALWFRAAVTMLHGYPQSHLGWQKVVPRFAKHYTVVCLDLRGYGDIDKPASSDAELSAFCKRTTANDSVVASFVIPILRKQEMANGHIKMGLGKEETLLIF